MLIGYRIEDALLSFVAVCCNLFLSFTKQKNGLEDATNTNKP